jgi:hypothetical protein
MVNRVIQKTSQFYSKLEKIKNYNKYFSDQIDIWILDVSTKNDLSKLGVKLGEKFSQKDLQTYDFLQPEFLHKRINDYYIIFAYDNKELDVIDIFNTEELKLEREQERTLKDDLEKQEQEEKKLTNSLSISPQQTKKEFFKIYRMLSNLRKTGYFNK